MNTKKLGMYLFVCKDFVDLSQRATPDDDDGQQKNVSHFVVQLKQDLFFLQFFVSFRVRCCVLLC